MQGITTSDTELHFSKFKSHFGADIGGTLAKVVFYEPPEPDKQKRNLLHENIKAARDFIVSSETYGGTGVRDTLLSLKFPDQARLHFIVFETRRMTGAFQMLTHQRGMLAGTSTLGCTGGGAFKYSPQFSSHFDIEVVKYDEMECLVSGLNFLLKHVPDEVFVYESPNGVQSVADPRPFQEKLLRQTNSLKDSSTPLFPYLLVNVGSGVSFLRVMDQGHHERIAGSALGGATFWGLAKKMTKVQDFGEALKLASIGSADTVNMTVGDIYGGDYKSIGLPSNMTASFFGKFVHKDPPFEEPSDADICNALLFMITNNLGQLSFLNAQRYGITRIFFAGNFLRGNEVAMQALHRAIQFWSQGQMRAHFLRHEGYFGALGAFLLHNGVDL